MRRNADEARAADRFSRAQELQQAKRKTIRSSSGKKKKRRTKVSSASSTGSNSSDDAPVVTLRRRQPSLVASTMDLTWKLGGALYPKQSSRVGDEYQVTELPAPGTAGKGDQSDLYELLYDPSNPNAAVVDKVLSGSIPVNKKERFFEKIGSTAMRSTSEFVCDNVQTLVQGLEPCDGSDWTIEEKALFHREVFRLRKDLKALSKVMGKDLKSCYTYYLSTFKKSNDYRALKVVREQERAGDSGSNVHGVDACAICGDGGSLIICDSCDGDYHINCLRPRLRAVPEGHWECDECVDRKLLEARDRIIANTKLYEQHGSHSNSATAEQPSSNEIAMRPSAGVLGAIKAFADGIDAVFNQKSQPIHEESQDETNTPKQKQDSVQETGTPLLHETAIEAA